MPVYSSTAGSLGNTIETAEIVNDAVTLAKLDDVTVIDPSLKRWTLHEIKDKDLTAFTSETFASLPAHNSWKLVFNVRGDHTTNSLLGLRIDGDTGGNYDTLRVTNTAGGGFANTTNGTYVILAELRGSTAGVNVSSGVVYLPGKPTSDNMGIGVTSCSFNDASVLLTCMGSIWKNASGDISSLTLQATQNVKGKFALYYSDDI